MSIDYHLADLAQKIFTPEISGRKESLMRSRGFYERFLKLLDSYDLLSKPDAKLYESYTEDKQNFSTVSTKDAAARRDIKIARFKEEKELKRKLEVCIVLQSQRAPS
jgi:immunoglobulin-binding protein 1